MLLFWLILILVFAKGSSGEEISNERLLNQLHLEESRRLRNGEDATVIEQTPLFENKAEEIKWKLNKAKRTLTRARQTEGIARTASKHFGFYNGNQGKHREIQDLITSAERTLLEAGDKLGYDYEKY